MTVQCGIQVTVTSTSGFAPANKDRPSPGTAPDLGSSNKSGTLQDQVSVQEVPLAPPRRTVTHKVWFLLFKRMTRSSLMMPQVVRLSSTSHPERMRTLWVSWTLSLEQWKLLSASSWRMGWSHHSTGDNSVQNVAINVLDALRVKITSAASGAITNLDLCVHMPTVVPTDSPSLWPTPPPTPSPPTFPPTFPPTPPTTPLLFR